MPGKVYNTNPDWTDERIQFLRDNYKTMVVRKIAEAFGELFTRNAIIGKARRLGLQADFRQGPHRSRSGELTVKKPNISPRGRIIIKREDRPMEEIRVRKLASKPVDIMELEGWHCREIVVEKPTVLYCGKHKTDGSSYCLDHHNKNHTRVGNVKVEKYYGL